MRSGGDARPSLAARRAMGCAAATWIAMLLQVARDDPGVPDLRTLRIGEIVFFYDGLRYELKNHTRPKPNG